MIARLALAALALVTAACGHDEPASENGRLVIQKSLDGPPVFIEGSATQFRIMRVDGSTVAEHVRWSAMLFDGSLAPGSYKLETVERPCSGNCGMLDEPVETTRCALDVRVVAGERSEVSIDVKRPATTAVTTCVTNSSSG